MVKMKQTLMEAAAHTDPEAWQQLDSLVQRKMSHNLRTP